jgi:two-component system OmpR family sensor kinase
MIKNLYQRLAAVLLGLFLHIGVLYIALTVYTTRLYFEEVNQKLNRILAQHLVSENILLKNGRVDNKALQNIFHMLMVVNPVIEVYLLDAKGNILSYSAPPGKVKRQSVSLDPLKRLLSGTSSFPVLGDDPRDLRQKKIFSAAPIYHDGRNEGYLYIILGSEAFETEAEMLQGSYILRLSIWAVAGGLLFALLAALLLFSRMTRPLRQLAVHMENFRRSGFSAPPRLPEGLHLPDDEIARISAIFMQMADRIAGQIKGLKEADSLRREFIANITHDLRTPLTSLQGYLETLLMKQGRLTDDEQRNFLTTAVKRSEQMGKLVAALFELAKLDSPDVQVHYADQKQVSLQMDIANELPRVYADIGLVERAFENLTDNALRYTPKNGAIRIQAERDQDRVRIEISDTGVGIPKESVPHLFDRYYNRDRSRKDPNAGSGLGLIITKRILELHGSDLEVTSMAGGGTTFLFSLPIFQATALTKDLPDHNQPLVLFAIVTNKLFFRDLAVTIAWYPRG